MAILLVLLGSFLICVILHDQVKRYPAVFYAAALALDAVFVAGYYGLFPGYVWDAMLLLMKKATLAYALFTIVMFVGVLPAGSKVRSMLAPIRGELSIVAFLSIMGHVALYTSVYASSLLVGSAVSKGTTASLLIAMLMLVLLVLLAVTSFDAIKKRMSAGSWKKTQMLAYPFYILVHIHLVLLLLPSALAGRATAQESVAVYLLIVSAYILLRLIRYRKDRNGARREHR